MVTALLDPATGPNLVQKNTLSKMCLENVLPIRASIRAGGDKTFRVEGVFFPRV